LRRTDEEIRDRSLIDEVLGKGLVCRLGLCRDNIPYVVPVSYGYDGAALYFHTAPVGLKIEFLEANPTACFEVEHEVRVVADPDRACRWSMSYYSVIGRGTVREVVDRAGKARGLNCVMRHYSGREWPFEEPELDGTRVWQLAVEEIRGKRSRDKAPG
jgi:nitroimidazol reductase NimA-like FMN-containing flavoprotein (pyridoxamine 5'-phosphate oxidase superfamily)